jgi:hypothetical protein
MMIISEIVKNAQELTKKIVLVGHTNVLNVMPKMVYYSEVTVSINPRLLIRVVLTNVTAVIPTKAQIQDLITKKYV